MKRIFALFAGLCAPIAMAFGQTSPEILASDIRTHVQYLSSDELAGRASGSEGNRKAAMYIADYMKREGIQPAGDSGGYFQKFEFVTAVRLGKNNALALSSSAGEQDLKVDEDFRPLAFSSSGEASGQLVFAGYGISATDTSYDDYAGLDVRDKIVIVLRYGPDGSSPHSAFGKYTSPRNKARVARDKGALAIVFINGPKDEQDDDLLKLTNDQSFEDSGIPAVSMKRSFAEALLQGTGKTLQSIQDTIRATMRPCPVALSGGRATLRTETIKVKARSANVVGLLPGNDPVLRDQVVVTGAHFDHLGYGGRGSGSLTPDTVAIHHGADDNASGTAGLLELMEVFSAQHKDLHRSILFIFFSGEELGTLGSRYFVNHPTVPLAQCVAMVNMDMIGRLDKDVLTVYGTGTSPAWSGLLEKFNKNTKFSLKEIPDGYGPSDHSMFYGKDLPVLFFFTGTHNDYHKPSDTWDKINYPGEEKVVRFVRNVVLAIDDVPERPQFARVQTSTPSSGGDNRGFSVTLGIIPDYAEGTQGLRIGGTKPNGPADKAGMKPGDVIVRMAGKKVMNIYDYMGLLGELKAGDEVEVAVIREGATLTVRATMEKRK